MSYGTEFAESIAGYLTSNNMKSLGCLNRKVLGELADDFQTKHEARRATRKRAQTEGEWLAELETDPANQTLVDGFHGEIDKCRMWLKKPANAKRRFTRTFFVNWLLGADRTVGLNGGGTTKPTPKKADPYTEPVNWRNYAHLVSDQLIEFEWFKIPITLRSDILNKMPK